VVVVIAHLFPLKNHVLHNYLHPNTVGDFIGVIGSCIGFNGCCTGFNGHCIGSTGSCAGSALVPMAIAKAMPTAMALDMPMGRYWQLVTCQIWRPFSGEWQ